MWTDFTEILSNKRKTNTYTHSYTKAQLENMLSLIPQSEDVRSCQWPHTYCGAQIFNFYILFQQSYSDFQGVWLLQLDECDYEWFAWGTFPGVLYKLTKTSEIVSVFSASK